MTGADVISLYGDLEKAGVKIWIDGGWCVDALLGKQTREHPDLDIAVGHKDASKLKELLIGQGYKDDPRNDTEKWMFAMKDSKSRIIDVHVFEYDENGKNIYGVEYPFGSLTGTGLIDGEPVNCIAPKWMFKFKTAYTPKEKDLQDVQALSKKFGFKLPAAYTGQQIVIDRAAPADAEGLANVHAKTWIATYPNEEMGITQEAIRIRVEGEHGELTPGKIERWKKELADEGDKRATFAARINGKVVGFVIALYVDGQRQIAAMYVLPEAQGKGIGANLMQKALNWWGRDQDIYLHVVSYNQHAIDFYEHFGFKRTGVEVKSNIAPMSDGNYLPQTEMVLKAKS